MIRPTTSELLHAVIAATALRPMSARSAGLSVSLRNQRAASATFGSDPHLARPVPLRRLGPEPQIGGGDHPAVVADDGGRAGRHEVGVAAVTRCDHGLAEHHRLGHAEPETLRAVQRRVDVAAGQQRFDLRPLRSSAIRTPFTLATASVSAASSSGNRCSSTALSTSCAEVPRSAGPNACRNSSTAAMTSRPRRTVRRPSRK